MPGESYPGDWVVRPLAEIVTGFLSGGTPSTSNPDYWNGTIPWITGADAEQQITTTARKHITPFGVRNSSTTVVPKGNILLVTRTGVGKVSIAGTDVAISQDLTGLIPNEDIVDTRFLYRQLHRSGTHLQRLTQGTIIQGIQREEVESLEIPIPVLPEQRRIAEILDTVDEAIADTEQVIAKLRQVKAGLLHDLLTCGLDEQGQLRDPVAHPEQFRDSPLGRIPREWEVQPLESCVSVNITYGIVQAGPHIEGGVPYIRTGDMTNRELSVSGLLKTSQEIAAAYKRSEVRAGEIVCAIRATVGQVLEVPPELDGANLTQGTARIAPLSSINSRFLLWMLRSEAVQRQFDAAVKGTTFREITLGALRTLKVAVPVKRKEQDAIVAVLDAHDARIRAEETYRDKLRLLKAGLMDDLLRGRVRVPV